MNDEEIALRLTEAWVGQKGLPSQINEVYNNYKWVLNKLKEEEN